MPSGDDNGEEPSSTRKKKLAISHKKRAAEDEDDEDGKPFPVKKARKPSKKISMAKEKSPPALEEDRFMIKEEDRFMIKEEVTDEI